MKISSLWNRVKTSHPVTHMLYLCFLVSFITLVIYLLDLDYSDKTLFMLLVVLRYSSFLLCGLSLYKLIINVYHTFHSSFSLRRFMKILIYFALIIYGLFIILLETFITVISGGNG